MSHTHGRHRPPDAAGALRLSAAPRVGLLLAVGLFVAAAALLAWRLWPEPGLTPAVTGSYAAPGVTFPRATVTGVLPACPPSTGPVSGTGSADQSGTTTPNASRTCGRATVRVDDGVDSGKSVTIDVPTEALRAGLQPGDRVVLLRLPDQAQGANGAVLDSPFSYGGIERGQPIAVVAAVFALLVILVGRWRGFAALVGLGFAGVVLLRFVAPALLQGKDPVLVAVASSVLIMVVVLYVTHGVSLRTSTAFVGTVVGVLVTAVAGTLAVNATHLTGVSDDDGGTLQALAGSVDLHALVAAGVIIGGLGALNDVTITQTSAVWELRAAGEELEPRRLFGHAMRIGRDHLASTVYTIVFAYAGTAMPVLLLLAVFDRPWADVLTSEDIATEVIRTIASSFGLILAVPLTTALAVLVATTARPRAQEEDEPPARHARIPAPV